MMWIDDVEAAVRLEKWNNLKKQLGERWANSTNDDGITAVFGRHYVSLTMDERHEVTAEMSNTSRASGRSKSADKALARCMTEVRALRDELTAMLEALDPEEEKRVQREKYPTRKRKAKKADPELGVCQHVMGYFQWRREGAELVASSNGKDVLKLQNPDSEGANWMFDVLDEGDCLFGGVGNATLASTLLFLNNSINDDPFFSALKKAKDA